MNVRRLVFADFFPVLQEFFSPKDLRAAALRRFATSITAFSLLGFFWLGFEASAAVAVSLLGVAYATDLTMEAFSAWIDQRAPKFLKGGPLCFVDFLLPSHIAALSTHFLIYTGAQIMPALLVIVIAVTSKYLFKAPFGGRWTHFLNPSNFGICCGLFFFPTVIGPAPMYHFTANVEGWLDAAVPAFLVSLGLLLNGRLTGRLPLIFAWLGGIVAQAVLRAVVFPQDFSVAGGLIFVTGAPLLLFSFFMISDPGTTPSGWKSQIIFGVSAAAAYAVLVASGINLGLFYCLFLTCTARGALAFGGAGAAHLKEIFRRKNLEKVPS